MAYISSIGDNHCTALLFENIDNAMDVIKTLLRDEEQAKENVGQYNNLAEIRKNRGLTGMALVKLMKEKNPQFDSPTLSRIENGKVLPTAETLNQLAEILGCETWEIVSPQYLM